MGEWNVNGWRGGGEGQTTFSRPLLSCHVFGLSGIPIINFHTCSSENILSLKEFKQTSIVINE